MNQFVFRVIVGLVAIVVCAKASSLPKDSLSAWESFKVTYNKVYESRGEEVMRRSIFMKNKQLVDEHNSRNELGNETSTSFKVALNHLSDLSESEMKARNGFKLPAGRLLENSDHAERFLQSIYEDNSMDLPDEVDWRKVPGRVTRVKDQGQCGSCWAFASTGTLEGQEMVRNITIDGQLINSKQAIELSEQNLVDCVTKDDECSGGIMQDALELVSQEGGINSEASYPYEAKSLGYFCRFKKSEAVFSDKGAAVLPEGDEQKLKEVVAKFGPVAVAIDASDPLFQVYSEGVYYIEKCHNKPNQLDHGVLVVGYGTDPKEGDYWIVKNSWAEKWGDHGYIKMARNRDNNCGIATMATIPTF